MGRMLGGNLPGKRGRLSLYDKPCAAAILADTLAIGFKVKPGGYAYLVAGGLVDEEKES